MVVNSEQLFLLVYCPQVETIGDAYMVVGGVPEKTTSHAEHVASFAIDLVEEAYTVESPDSGKPIQVTSLSRCLYHISDDI